MGVFCACHQATPSLTDGSTANDAKGDGHAGASSLEATLGAHSPVGKGPLKVESVDQPECEQGRDRKTEGKEREIGRQRRKREEVLK